MNPDFSTDSFVFVLQAYLQKYGYITSGGGSGRTSALRSLENDIAEFQRFAGLNVTGQSRDIAEFQRFAGLSVTG